MDALRTLEILSTSRIPLIGIQTLEEERVAQRLRVPPFVSIVTRGFRRAGALDALYDTKEPLKALRNLADLREEIKATKPLSVTRAEEVQDLREWARGRAVSAS